jgi:hypothetical protein
MASAVATKHITTRRQLKSALVPDAHSAAQYPLWFDMKEFRFLLVQLFFAVKGASGGITTFELTASDSADGSTNKTQIKVFTTPNDAGQNAVGDMVNLELSAEELNQIGRNNGTLPNGIALRYVSAKVVTVAAADTVIATYLGDEAMFPRDGLTSDVIA